MYYGTPNALRESTFYSYGNHGVYRGREFEGAGFSRKAFRGFPIFHLTIGEMR